jgi:hypothetical protein
MNLYSSSLSRRTPLTARLVLSFFALSPIATHAATAPALLDDFSNIQRTHSGAERLVIDDKAMGSQSQATQKCEDGILRVKGELVPGRGLPAFISVPLLLSADAKPQDLSGYEGVRIRMKVLKGIVTVQVASSEIQNFDYHTSGPVTGKRGEFSEVRLAFKDMKRAWSEQTALNLSSITSVNLVAFGMAKDAFAYEVDEIGFY